MNCIFVTLDFWVLELGLWVGIVFLIYGILGFDCFGVGCFDFFCLWTGFGFLVSFWVLMFGFLGFGFCSLGWFGICIVLSVGVYLRGLQLCFVCFG